MKILHLLNEFDNVGNGIVNVCCDLACIQAKKGNDVLVLSKEGEFSQLSKIYGVNFKVLNQDRKIGNIFKMFFLFHKYIKEFRPDIINCHMMTGLILAKIFQPFFGYNIVSTVHNVYQKSSFLMRFSNKLVCLSQGIYDHFLNSGVNKDKLIIIENGVIGSPRRDLKENIKEIKLRHPALVSIGAVCHRKGTDILIRAVELLHEKNNKVNLYLVGNIDWPELYQSVNNSRVSDYIHFEGLNKQPQKYLIDADIYILASRRETFPLSLLEAKEYGLPIISSNVDGCPDALDNGMSGLLFQSENSEDLVVKIEQLLCDNNLMNKMRMQSIQSSSKYTVSEMTDKYLDMYSKLIK